MRSHPRLGVVRVAAGLALVAAATSLTAAGPATAVTDLPDTYAAATRAAVSPNATALRSTIDSPTDQDWFKFTVTRATKAAVTLGSLPGNYSLAVYDGAGNRIALSAYAGTHFERVFPSVAPGTYYVRVATQGDFSRTKAYMLRFRPLPAGLVTLDQYARLTVPHRVVATIFNNSGTWKWIPEVHYTWYDRNHRVLRREVGGMDYTSWIVPPFSTRPFKLSLRPSPAGAASVSVTALSEEIRRPNSVPVVKVSGVRSRYVSGRFAHTEVTGTASSTSPRQVQALVQSEAYNANGTLIDVDHWYVDVGAGRTDRFKTELDIRSPNAIWTYGLVEYNWPVPVEP